MKINIFPIVSSLHEKERINNSTKMLLDELIKSSNHEFNIVDINHFYESDLSLILIQSGGSEQLFLNNLDKLKAPYYLLTYGNNNSLAASLEILSYIKDKGEDGEVIHGSNSYIVKRINELLEKKEAKYRYGVLGKPSDWLIASNVDYKQALNKHNIELVNLNIDDILNNYKFNFNSFKTDYDFDKEEVNKALRLHEAIYQCIKDNHLDGITIRCFDLLSRIKTTSCLSLSLLNDMNIVSTCEGDIPTMISMHVLKVVTGQMGFQANPSRINIDDLTMVLAHCTLPTNMTTSYSLDTHFESGIGIAIKGKLKEEKITIFKLSKNLKDFYVTTGKIITSLNDDNLCRTQILISIDDNIEYFLSRPYGNHHVIVYGDYKNKLIEYMKNI